MAGPEPTCTDVMSLLGSRLHVWSDSPLDWTIEFAVAAARLKQSVRADINLALTAEAEAVLEDAPHDRVVR